MSKATQHPKKKIGPKTMAAATTIHGKLRLPSGLAVLKFTRWREKVKTSGKVYTKADRKENHYFGIHEA